MPPWLTIEDLCMVATLSGKTKKNDKSPEKSGENGGYRKKVLKSQEIWIKMLLIIKS